VTAHGGGIMRDERRKAGTPVWVWLAVAGGATFLVLAGCCGVGFWMIGKRGQTTADTKAESLKWGESATVGPLRVGLKSASLTSYSGSSPSGVVHNSTTPGVVVVVQVTTDDKTKEHTAKGAIGSAKLADDHGNDLPVMRLKAETGFTCQIHGQLKAGSSYAVRSDDPLTDTLVFDRPVEAAGTLTLKLDARNYGGDGPLLFEIPRDVWKRK